jgi:hypothetical protein
MKSFAVYGGLGFIAMLSFALASGVITIRPHSSDPGRTGLEDAAKPRAKFPQDLAPAARAQAVPEAAVFTPSNKYYPMVILKPSGQLHAWQEKLGDEWQAESVETTQLALVVGADKKRLLSRTDYPNGAPPVERWQFELEVSVVEPKTGKVVANRMFHNVPRGIKQIEGWELTMIAQPVQFRTVFNWAVSEARVGFPKLTEPRPLITIVGD